MFVEIHTTDRSAFKRCRQRWDFSSNLRMNLEPKRPIDPLWFGIGAHRAWASYYDPETPRSYDIGMNTFRSYVTDWIARQGTDLSEDQELWAKEMLELGEGIFDYYFGWAPTHDDFDVIWVEKSFNVEIPHMPGVDYSFRVDGLVQDKHERLWILEHKTAASFPQDEEWLALDDQCGSYLWALRSLGINCEGVIYNTLRKKPPMRLRRLKDGTLSVAKNQDTTYDLALAAIKADYGSKKSKVPVKYLDYLDFLRTKPNNFVRRMPVRRSTRELDLLGEELHLEVLDMVNAPTIYRSPSRINCSGCPFIAPCIAKWDGSDYKWLLEQNYQEREKVV